MRERVLPPDSEMPAYTLPDPLRALDGRRIATGDEWRRLVALGVKVEITEMDVKLQGDSRPLADKLQIEGSYYHDMLQACLSVKGCDAFVMWGFTDRYTWINHLTGNVDQPLIFDAAYRPKPSYHGLIDALI